MKEIKIRFFINNKLFIGNIKIIDKNNNITFLSLSNDNYYHFCGCINDTYKIEVNNYIFIILITNNYNKPYLFNINIPKTIYLFDKNYINLKVKEGTINLWPNNIL